MLSTSNVSAAQAETYYTEDDYYVGDAQPSVSRWYGRGAEVVGLSGGVEPEAFVNLLNGIAPDGRSLVGKTIDLKKRRAATDYTFSAPKSASLAALVQQDERVLAAHQQAVNQALAILENRYAQTRISQAGNRQRVATGNLIAGVFTHTTSREIEPQLHSHCVVINATQLPDGQWYSFSNEEAIAHQKLLGQVYQNELAIVLQQQGYEIEPRANGQFELKGYSPELLKLFSTRCQQIEQLLSTWESERLPTVRSDAVHASAARREAATLRSRRSKPKAIAQDKLLRGWNALIKLKGLQLPTLPKPNATSDQDVDSARAVVEMAIRHCGERETVFRRSQLERFVLEHNLGELSFDQVQEAIARNPELIQVAPGKFTTQSAINLELNTIRLMQQSRGQMKPVIRPTASDSDSPKFDPFLEHQTLTAGQQQAIHLALTTRDQFIAWQGAAGSGKTSALRVVKAIAQTQGYQVRGFTPSAEAAHLLGQTLEVETETVAGLLVTQPSLETMLVSRQTSKPPELWIVDEAGLLSMKDAHALLSLASMEQAKVLLVGDTRQLSAVEAGNPFKSLLAGGIAIAHLDENLRQQTRQLKTAVEFLADGKAAEGIAALDDAGCIQVIPNPDERLAQLAEDYLRLPSVERETTLILAGTNQERRMLTQKIRQGLQQEGMLGNDRLTVTGLRQRDLTKAQASYASAYAVGNVLVFQKNYPGQNLIKRGQYTVLEKNPELNQLTLQNPEGQITQVNPALCREKTVYEAEQFGVGVGDRLRWTKNNRAAGIRNGQTFTVNQISATGTARITDADGRQRTICLTGKQFIDYAWVNTTYSSQGKTADRVLALMDSTTSKESFYVAVSRARHHLTLYTSNKSELLQLAQKSRAKENVSDYISLTQGATHHVPTSKTTQRSAIPGTADPDFWKHFGERVGDRLSQMLATAPNRPLSRERQNPADGAENAAPDRNLAAIAANLDRYLEPVAQAITDHLEQRQLRQYIGDLAGAVAAVDRSLEPMESAIANRTHVAAAIDRLNQAIGDQAQRIQSSPYGISGRPGRNRTELGTVSNHHQPPNASLDTFEPEPSTGISPTNSTTERYKKLWQRYVQKLQERDPIKLDFAVAQSAFEDGHSQRVIALMLVAGSPNVRERSQIQGKSEARNYVNRLARSLCQPKSKQSLHRKRQLELS
jgi:conjugative relaxase-like TrwC/TraI family protein